MLDRFLKHDNVKIDEKAGRYYKNICYLNSTKVKVNEKCCKRFTRERKAEDIPIEFH